MVVALYWTLHQPNSQTPHDPTMVMNANEAKVMKFAQNMIDLQKEVSPMEKPKLPDTQVGYEPPPAVKYLAVEPNY